MHQTVKVDTQGAYLGTANGADLIKEIGLMSNKRDTQAPVKPDPENGRLGNHPELCALKAKQKCLKPILKAV